MKMFLPAYLVVGCEGRVVPRARPGPVVHDHRGKVVQARPGVGEPGPGQVLQQVARHIQPVDGELDVIV